MNKRFLQKRIMRVILAAIVFVMVFPHYIFALPTDGTVVSGQAQISQTSAVDMRIDQSTQQAIINWNQFSIAAPESVRFFQPGSLATVLNRVTGVDPSLLYGLLSANGRVFVVNPNGILVGPTGRIETGAFVASTLNITDQDFLSGDFFFNQIPGRSLSSILNQGTISVAENGFVSLLAPGVTNEGSILANLGKVFIGGGESIKLEFAGNDLINFIIDEEVSDIPVGPDGESLDSILSNTGEISAAGGKVVLSAKTAGDLVKSVVANQGIIKAQGMVKKDGEIILTGGDAGVVTNSGVLDVSGASGGGAVAMHGADVANAGEIIADATDQGDGGTVEIIGTQSASFTGLISAMGGPNGGDGGFVEVSAPALQLGGDVYTLAPLGNAGMFLIDPANWTISTAADSGTNYNTTTLVNNLAGSPITLIADTTDIVVQNGFTWNSANALTLDANTDVTVNLGQTIANNSTGDLIFIAGNNVNLNGGVSLNGGSFTAGTLGTPLGGAFTSGAAGVISTGGGCGHDRIHGCDRAGRCFDQHGPGRHFRFQHQHRRQCRFR